MLSTFFYSVSELNTIHYQEISGNRNREDDSIDSQDLEYCQPSVHARVMNGRDLNDGGRNGQEKIANISRLAKESPPVREGDNESKDDLNIENNCHHQFSGVCY